MVAKSGGSGQLLDTGDSSFGIGRVISDGAFAYYLSLYNVIYRISTTGTGTTSFVAAGPYGSTVSDLFVSGNELFWTNDGTYSDNTYTTKVPGSAYVASTPVTGSTTLGHHAMPAGLSSPLQRITADASNVYFIDGTNVYRQSRNGGSPVVLAPIAPASGTIVDLHADGAYLYFADLHAVYRLPTAGGSVETLSAGWSSLRSLAVDAESVYFTDYGGNQVLKRPK
jgi:hypothetical protein